MGEGVQPPNSVLWIRHSPLRNSHSFSLLCVSISYLKLFDVVLQLQKVLAIQNHVACIHNYFFFLLVHCCIDDNAFPRAHSILWNGLHTGHIAYDSKHRDYISFNDEHPSFHLHVYYYFPIAHLSPPPIQLWNFLTKTEKTEVGGARSWATPLLLCLLIYITFSQIFMFPTVIQG